jgi:hypothetical protein
MQPLNILWTPFYRMKLFTLLDCGTLNYDTIWSGRWIPMLWRNILSPNLRPDIPRPNLKLKTVFKLSRTSYQIAVTTQSSLSCKSHIFCCIIFLCSFIWMCSNNQPIFNSNLLIQIYTVASPFKDAWVQDNGTLLGFSFYSFSSGGVRLSPLGR